MILKKWCDMPENLKNNKTKLYYDILENKKTSLIIKKSFDFLLSLVFLIILLPVFLVMSIIIKLDSKGPIFYKQERITQYGRTFKIFKFRTMINDADKIGSLVTLDNDCRITKIGKLLRKLRLDELPQLINILKGDMTFVGTRPEVKKYVDNYTDEMKVTLLLPAGVTSYASIEFKDEDKVMGRYRLQEESVDDIYINKILPLKMVYNLEYIKSFSIWNDIKISCKTVFAVLNIVKKKNEQSQEKINQKNKVEVTK